MANPHSETIVAIITGSVPSPVALVRISGGRSAEVAQKVFHPWPKRVESRRLYYGKVAELDEGFLVQFDPERSYTGEHCFEISLHGSLASVERLVGSCVAAGARLARPGEFTERAFLNGRIGLTEAEAVADTIAARSEVQLAQATLLRDGALANALTVVESAILDALATIEAHVDFSEELGEFDPRTVVLSLVNVENQLVQLIETGPAGRLLRQGLRVAICGRPNVGKSSLLNALLGSNRSIVTDIPGTTRDFIEEEISLGGVTCVLIDTAGLRETNDQVELAGIAKTREIAKGADFVWLLYESNSGPMAEDEFFAQQFKERVVWVATKSDLGAIQGPGIPVSVIKSDGLAGLKQFVEQLLTLNPREVPFVHDHHLVHLNAALEGVRLAKSTLLQDLPFDLASTGLNRALAAIGRITGKAADADVLTNIFSRFCIGK